MYGRKFEKELIALRRDFEEQQLQLSKYASPASTASTPPSTASIVAAGPGGEEMSRVTSLDALNEEKHAEEEEDEELVGSEEGSGEEIKLEDAAEGNADEEKHTNDVAEEGFGAVSKPV